MRTRLIETALGAYRSPEFVSGLRGVAQSVGKARNFDALKALRALFPLEDAELKRDAEATAGMNEET